MTKLYRTVSKMKWHHDVESSVMLWTEGGLDQASGPSHKILVTRHSESAHPGCMHRHRQPLPQRRRQMIEAVVAVEVLQCHGAAGQAQGHNDFKIPPLPGTRSRLNNTTRPRHLITITSDSLPPNPWQARIIIIAVKMPQFHRAAGQTQGHNDFKIPPLPGTRSRLNDTARSRDVVPFARDTLSTDPRQPNLAVVRRPRQVNITIVAVPVPQLSVFYDNCLKITVTASCETRLDQTDIHSGQFNRPFPIQ
jgi:hypothetical protein